MMMVSEFYYWDVYLNNRSPHNAKGE